jgi:hypothetical protein
LVPFADVRSSGRAECKRLAPVPRDLGRREIAAALVAISLIAAILVVGIGISTRVADIATARATGPVSKIGKPVMWTGTPS